MKNSPAGGEGKGCLYKTGESEMCYMSSSFPNQIRCYLKGRARCGEPGAIGQGCAAWQMVPLPRTVLTCGKCPGRFANWRGLSCGAWGRSGCPCIKAGPLNRELELKLAETGAERGWMLLCCWPRVCGSCGG